MINRSEKLRVAAIKRALRAKLPQAVNESQIADEIEKYLFKHFETVPAKPKLARGVASHLSGQFLITGKRALGWLECIIEIYPEEIERLSSQAGIEALMRLARAGKLPNSPVAHVPRKFWGPTTRIQKKQQSKNRYDFKRKGYREGLIEQQFGGFVFRQAALGEPLHARRKCDCLDELFEGKTIKMLRTRVFSRNLFGLDRHRFPKKLPTVRTGREVEYTLVAVVQCMVALRADEESGRGPTHLKIRNTILCGIIERAQGKSGKLLFNFAGDVPNVLELIRVRWRGRSFLRYSRRSEFGYVGY